MSTMAPDEENIVTQSKNNHKRPHYAGGGDIRRHNGDKVRLHRQIVKSNYQYKSWPWKTLILELIISEIYVNLMLIFKILIVIVNHLKG